MNERDPLTRQRSTWHPVGPVDIGPIKGHSHERNVGDGILLAIVMHEPAGLHLSVSHCRITKRAIVYPRYPRWDEIADARDRFLPADRPFVMVLPREGEYVAEHPTTFHLHELTVDLARYATQKGQ